MAVLGAGTVGREVVRAFEPDTGAARAGRGAPLVLVGVAVRDLGPGPRARVVDADR